MTRVFASRFVMCVALTGVASAQTNSAGSAARCAQLSSLQISGTTLAITKAEWTPTGPATTNPNAPASTSALRVSAART